MGMVGVYSQGETGHEDETEWEVHDDRDLNLEQLFGWFLRT